MNNSFGNIFTLTTAGESHGPALVGILDGVPAGFRIDFSQIDELLALRRPGQILSTPRAESDKVEFLSGILDGVTLGSPIAFIIKNNAQISSDYSHLKKTFRPSHADFTYQAKYGIRDVRGGGRASARETVVRVVAGAIALQILSQKGIEIQAYTTRIGKISVENPYATFDFHAIIESPVRCPFPEISRKMEKHLAKIRKEGDTVGAAVSCVISGLPAGIGEPMYNKLSARLSFAMMSINAAHSFEFGDGLSLSSSLGSEANDPFCIRDDGSIATSTNRSGGIQGGISNSMPVNFTVGFKPLPTLMMPQPSVDLAGNKIIIEPRGRHDSCVVPRVIPVVRAMAALTVLDLIFLNNAVR